MESQFSRILTTYVTEARPFFVAHMVCVLVVGWRMLQLLKERRDLQNWLVAPASPGLVREGSIAHLFHELLASIREFGPKGDSVDAGEHLQRIEDAVARKETHVSDAVHWFLLIGIAGTLFGLFEFAANMQEKTKTGTQAEIVVAVGDYLASAMAKAFPVGFVGVVLLIVGQLVASLIESSLDGVVGKATSRVMRIRREITEAQTEFIEAVRESIRESMAPLGHLQVILEESLKPVITTFKGSLDEALELVRQQMDEMHRFVGQMPDIQQGFLEASARIRLTSEALNRFAETFSSRLDAIDRQSQSLQQNAQATIHWSDKLITLSKAQQDQIDGMRAANDLTLEAASEMTDRVEEIVKSISEASASVHQIPVLLQQAVTTTIPSVVESAGARLLDEWGTSARAMSQDLGGTVESSMGRLIHGLERITTKIESTLSEWERVNQNVESLVKDVIEAAIQNATAPNREFAAQTKEVVAEVKSVIHLRQSTVQELQAAIGSLAGVMNSFRAQLDPVTQSFEKSAARVEIAASALEKAAVLVHSVSRGDSDNATP